MPLPLTVPLEVALPVAPEEYCELLEALGEVLLAPFVPDILLVLLPVACVPEADGVVDDEVLLPVVCA